jgi:hypothetical protein
MRLWIGRHFSDARDMVGAVVIKKTKQEIVFRSAVLGGEPIALLGQSPVQMHVAAVDVEVLAGDMTGLRGKQE